jgi:peptidoglycan/LPS O-acetylase OafA/YrhL
MDARISPQPLPALTGLRFVAAFTVAVSHAYSRLAPISGNSSILCSMVINLSGIGMPLFFVLSGFVIHYNYCEQMETKRGIYNFFVARFARLYPLYLCGISFDLLNSFSYRQVNPHLTEAIPYYLTMIQSWLYKPVGDTSLIYVFGPIPQVAWSLSTEWFFYAAYPLICLPILAMRRLRTQILAAAIFVCFAFAVVATIVVNRETIAEVGMRAFGPIAQSRQDGLFRWLLYFSPYSRILEFILGCFMASIYIKSRGSTPNAKERALGLCALIIAIAWTATIYFIMFGLSFDPRFRWARFIGYFHMSCGLAPGLAVIIYCSARYRNIVVRALSQNWLVLCGEASYSLYLFHVYVIDQFGQKAPVVTDFRVGIGSISRLAFCLMTCIGLSLVTWRIIEVPARRWLRGALSIRDPFSVRVGSPIR